jgi:hypothetical protein
MTLEPGGDFGVFVGGIVVANDVKLIDLAQWRAAVWGNTLPER